MSTLKGQSNFITDGDMETPGTIGWVPDSSTTLTKDAFCHRGTQSLKIVPVGTVSACAVYRNCSLTAGTQYRLTGWAYSHNGRTAFLSSWSTSIWVSTKHNEWEYVDVIFTANDAYIRFVVNKDSTGFYNFIDDLRIEEYKGITTRKDSAFLVDLPFQYIRNNKIPNKGTAGKVGIVTGAIPCEGVDDTKALSFDGVDNVIDCGSPIFPITLPNGATVSMWVKPDVTCSSYAALFSQNVHFYARMNRFIIYTSSGYSILNYTMPKGNWIHVVFVYDGTYQKIYLNGVEVASMSTLDTPQVSVSRNTFIGDLYYTVNPFKGFLDKLIMLDRPWVPQEVLDEYAAVKLGHTPTDGLISYPDLGSVTPSNQLIDIAPSIKALTGTVVGSPANITGVDGKFNTLSFDGINDAVTVPINIANLASAFTIVFWVKWNQTGSVIYFANIGNSTDWPIRIYDNGGGTIRARIIDNAGGSVYLTTLNSYGDNDWHLVNVIWDGAHVSLNIDAGAEEKTTSLTSVKQSVNSNFELGRVDIAYGKCDIDKPRLYNRELSIPEKSNMYNREKP